MWSNPNTGATDDADARRWLDQLRDGPPSDKIEARDRLAAIFERRGLLAEAAECLEENIRRGVRDRRLYERLAGLYRRQGRIELADEVLEEAAKLSDDPGAEVVGRTRRAWTTTRPHVAAATQDTRTRVAPHLDPPATGPVQTPSPKANPAPPIRIDGNRIALVAALVALVLAVWSTFRPAQTQPQAAQQEAPQRARPAPQAPAVAPQPVYNPAPLSVPAEPPRCYLCESVERERQRELEGRVNAIENERYWERQQREMDRARESFDRWTSSWPQP